MITDDQVAELFSEANPVPTLDVLDAVGPVDDGTDTQTAEGSRAMTTVKTDKRDSAKRSRRPLIPAGLAVVLAAVIAIPLLLPDGEQPELAAPATPEEEAIKTAEGFFAALTADDVNGAMALMTPEVQEAVGNRAAVEFFAALPGTKTLSDCTTREGNPGVFTVRCATNYNGPLMQSVGEQSEGTFTVEGGLLTTMFIPGSREATATAFFEYASETEPAAFDEACSPESYEVGSVRTQGTGFAFAGPCGELWARVAEDAAAWVEAGRPSLSQDN